MILTALRIAVTILLWLAIAVGLAVTIVPHFLDRVYYRGDVSDHFDGARFFNPDGDDTTAPPTGGSRGGFFWRYVTGNDGRPAWPTTVPVAAGKPAASVAGDAMVATWIGHATTLIQTRGVNILTDPVWSERAGPLGFGPKRVAAPGVALADLPRIHVVLISHNHYDHLDLATLKALWQRDRPLIVTALGNDAILRSVGIEAQALDWGQSVAVGDPAAAVRVHVTRNHHWGSRWFADRNRALWSSFVVALPGGNVFFAGDTGMGDGNWPVEAAALGPIRLALIPIGAFRFVPGQMVSGSHIGPIDAVEVFRRLGAARAFPIHWGTFRLSYEAYDTPPKLLAAAMRCTGQSGFAPVAIGVPQVVAPYAAPAAAPPLTREALVACLDTPAVRALQ
ncbi:MBL fold metallo-hydrolase [Sphingomonas donggukensis]|uniref:MBL fold metallo-hydrolase n=1 Tax=Sphingomonas donggukensis TaxID=2949093 RepID=A0ABY4TS03_9SPHN|nr:MBL fold metallo-hydrolase [Sphingomonas donggukensis]URW75182.1 MBL fold metallo-hydrolase [Sphingomonas donggukensis]